MKTKEHKEKEDYHFSVERVKTPLQDLFVCPGMKEASWASGLWSSGLQGMARVQLSPGAARNGGSHLASAAGMDHTAS